MTSQYSVKQAQTDLISSARRGVPKIAATPAECWQSTDKT